MIKSVTNYPVSQMFDIESNVIYLIPRYQREYTWKKEQWESLFDDVFAHDKGYFLGSIICINQAIDSLGPQYLEIVDGQQRLTTLSLLFAAIFSILKEKEELFDDDDKRSDLNNLKRKIILKSSSDLRVRPQIQNSNLDDYRALLGELKIINEQNKPKNAGNRKIYRAFSYFRSRLGDLEEKEVWGFLDKINSSCLVKIEVVSHADAYTLFESLNNRGMPLTAIDLIKNKLLSKTDEESNGGIDDYFKKWNHLLSYLSEDYTVQERFFRQYYNAFIRGCQQPPATRTNLISVYEKLIEKDGVRIVDSLLEAGKVYSLFLTKEQDVVDSALVSSLRGLERIQGSPSYLLLLFIFSKKSELKVSDDDFVYIVKLLVCFFVRRNLTDTPPTRDMNRLFISLVDSIKDLIGNQVKDHIRKTLIDVSADESRFDEMLKGPIYDENSSVARFILCSLAEKEMTSETFIDLWQSKGQHFFWTIEHILPQGENIPTDWVKMIAGDEYDKAKKIQEIYVHKLGNLTITGFNSSLGNKSFIEKRDRVDSDGRYIGYKNNLSLNKDIAVKEVWNNETIEERTDTLVRRTKELFSF